jgi:hypothetical protein
VEPTRCVQTFQLPGTVNYSVDGAQFLPQLKGKVVQILTDNVTAAAYVNIQGGQSVEMTDISMAIWDLCVRHNKYFRQTFGGKI